MDNYDGCSAGVHDINPPQDPKYGSYELQSTSPCIDAIPAPTPPSPPTDPVAIDYPGYSRPKGSGFDMGAYEYVPVKTYTYTLPGGTGIVTDYRMFTVPLGLGTGADMRSAMENKLGVYNPTRWRVFSYSSANYIEMNTQAFMSQNIIPGMGFWIITRTRTLSPFRGKSALTESIIR